MGHEVRASQRQHNADVLRQTVCLVVNPVKVNNFHELCLPL